jgi:DNA-binding transcriptional MerR regulator
MMIETASENFPIRTVSEITGVNAVTLRAWERRYGLIKPSRTPKGHRLYSRQDIQLIQEILRRLAQGMSISQITRSLLEQSSTDELESATSWDQYARRMIDAIAAFDEAALDATYNDAMSLYPVDIVTRRLITPLLKELGNRWQSRSGAIAEEHFFSVYLRNKLGARFHHQNLKNFGPKLIVACLPGEYHEFGILLFALTANNRGFQIILLGADLPVDELKYVVAKTGSQAIVLAGSASVDCQTLYQDIERLTQQVSIPVYVGGEATSSCRQQIMRARGVPLADDLAGSIDIINNTLRRTS